VFFDAVLSFSESYQSRLTSHPIDSTGRGETPYASDHVITENPTFTINGVVSGSDFGLGRPSSDEFGLINETKMSGFVEVTSTTDSMFSKLAGTLLPFGTSAEPEVTIGTRTSASLAAVKNQLISIRDNRETVTLVEFTNAQPTRWELNLIITSLQFSEDASTGDSLSVDLILQRANFVDLVYTKVPINSKSTSGKTKDSASPTVDKGAKNPEELSHLQETVGAVVDFSKKVSAYLSK
jgi:hypothetical protein